jgi:hypothetical protein
MSMLERSIALLAVDCAEAFAVAEMTNAPNARREEM